MKDQNKEAIRKLQKLGARLRMGWANQRPAKGDSFEAIAALVRKKWEKQPKQIETHSRNFSTAGKSRDLKTEKAKDILTSFQGMKPLTPENFTITAEGKRPRLLKAKSTAKTKGAKRERRKGSSRTTVRDAGAKPKSI